MTKQGFIEGLRRALAGKIETNRLNEIIKYYEDFIMIEMRKGQSEQEVLKKLGDPRLIAKSILAAEPGTRADYVVNESTESESANYDKKGIFDWFKDLPKSLKAIIIGILIVFVLALVFKIVAFLVPIVIPVAFLIWFIKFLKDR